MSTSTRFLTIAAVVVLGAGIYFYVAGFLPDTNNQQPPQVSTDPIYSSDKYGISFSYPETYQLTEMHAEGSAMREHHTIVLQQKTDLPAPEGGEGPPSITIDIYQNNLDNRATEDWIRGDSRSNFKLGDGTIASTTIDGKPALSYRWSGLYEGTTVAMARPDWIYAFNVTYLEMGADIIQDFVALRENVQIR